MTAATGADATLDERLLRDFMHIEPDGKFLQGLIESFAGNSQNLLAQLRTALAAGELQAVGATAHQLAGMTGNLGVTEMMQLSREMQRLAKEGTLHGCERLLTQCEHARERGLALLHDFLATHRKPKVQETSPVSGADGI